jgi:hypothetical protein
MGECDTLSLLYRGCADSYQFDDPDPLVGLKLILVHVYNRCFSFVWAVCARLDNISKRPLDKYSSQIQYGYEKNAEF